MKMKMKRSSVEELLSKMGFSEQEKTVFLHSIQLTKQEREDDNFSAKEVIAKEVKEQIHYEV